MTDENTVSAKLVKGQQPASSFVCLYCKTSYHCRVPIGTDAGMFTTRLKPTVGCFYTKVGLMYKQERSVCSFEPPSRITNSGR